MIKLIYPAHEFLYFHNSLAAIVEQPGRYARIDWQAAPMVSCELREVYENLLLLLTEAQLQKVLSDNQLMPAIMPSDQDWLVRDWTPRATQQSGYHCCAVIDSLDVYNRRATRRMVQRLQDCTSVTIAHFPDLNSAESWLLT